MSKRIRVVAVVWAALLVVALVGLCRPGWAAPGARATPAPSSCNRVTLQAPPLWLSGATWLENSSKLLVVDPFQNQLIAYDSQGNSTIVPAPRLSSSRAFQPAKITSTGDGVLLELVDGSFVSLDRKLGVVRETVLPRKSAGGGEHVGSLYQWTFAGDKLVGFGTLTEPDGSFRLGLLRTPLRSAGKVEMLKPFQEGDFYLLGYSYLANLGSDVYFVSMDKYPAIYRVSPGRRPLAKLASFPEEYRVRPDLQTRVTGPKSAPARYAEIETLSMPAGLYAQDGMLYLLTRTPEGKGKTAWWLYKIDPEKDVILGRVKLPTTASHLTLVAAEESWVAIERGPVEPQQRQQIRSMVTIPSSAISSLSVSEACASLQQ